MAFNDEIPVYFFVSFCIDVGPFQQTLHMVINFFKKFKKSYRRFFELDPDPH